MRVVLVDAAAMPNGAPQSGVRRHASVSRSRWRRRAPYSLQMNASSARMVRGAWSRRRSVAVCSSSSI